MDRIKRPQLFLLQAYLVALRGTCLRANVGCVIVKDSRIVTIGYNGSLPDSPHCTDETCTPQSPCKSSVHAEANAIYYAARKGISLDGATLYCTHSPCIKCTEALIQAGIKHVVYGKEYRETDFDKLNHCGVSHEHIEGTTLQNFIPQLGIYED